MSGRGRGQTKKRLAHFTRRWAIRPPKAISGPRAKSEMKKRSNNLTRLEDKKRNHRHNYGRVTDDHIGFKGKKS